MEAALSDDQSRDILGRMLAMRRFEEAVFALRQERLFGGHYHLYIGQEATGAAVMAALGEQDRIYSTHRNHGHLIARGTDPGRGLAEIIGRVGGLNGGRGGTFHLADATIGMPHTSALVGGCVPLAAGAALAAKVDGTDGVGVAMFGDGALEEGVVFETLNLAKIWDLPVIFMCENNTPGALGRAQGGSNSSRLATESLSGIAASMELESHSVDGGDAQAVFALVSDVVARCRKGNGPVFIEALTERWPGNYGRWPDMVTGETVLAKAWDDSLIPKDHDKWHRTDDPLLRFLRTLTASGTVTADDIEAQDSSVRQNMEAAKAFARESSVPDTATVADHVFAPSNTPAGREDMP